MPVNRGVVIWLVVDVAVMAAISELVATAAAAGRRVVGRQQGGADRHGDYETDRGRLHRSTPGKMGVGEPRKLVGNGFTAIPTFSYGRIVGCYSGLPIFLKETQ
jgi:hypothetical protein